MTRLSLLSRTGVSLCTLASAAALGQALPEASAWRDRERLLAHFELVGEVNLKVVYLRCARESSQRLLGFDEAARCSVAGEFLRVRSFGGDFNALLAWWRQHRDDPIDEPGDAGSVAVRRSSR